MRLVLGSDHAGFQLRGLLASWAKQHGHEVVEVGAQDENPYDYPDAADLAIKPLLQGEFDKGILVCGSGGGVCIRANRYIGVRAILCYNVEQAWLARQHDHANVLCLGQRLTSSQNAIQILDTFLKTPEDLDERHCRRVQKLDQPL